MTPAVHPPDPMRRPRRGLLCGLALLALAGCTHVPPARVTADRMDYGQVVAESWKRQTLLNVVRLRYADAPMFLDVASIINSYTVGVFDQLPSPPNVSKFGAAPSGSCALPVTLPAIE